MLSTKNRLTRVGGCGDSTLAQRGFTLIELMVTVSIIGVLSIYAQSRLARTMEEQLAQASAVYISTVTSAAQNQTLLNFNEYSAGLPVPGIAAPLQPTLAELQALGRLGGGFPIAANSMPTQQTIQVNITPVACPGPACTLQVLACTTTPVTLGGANVRFDLASIMMSEQRGSGAQSWQGTGNVVRGPLMNVANPIGNVEGIVCGTSAVDTAMFQQFVRVGDNRDPALNGNLTVAGATTLNGLTTVNNNLIVTGRTNTGDLNVGPCISMSGANGRAGFGCQNMDNLPAGYAGGVRSVDVVANANILASDNPAGFSGANTNFALVTANNGTGQAEIRTSGRAAANRLTPVGLFAAGSVCPAADEGSIARLLGSTGLVVCQNGSWVPLATQDAPGTPCTVEGAMSKAANTVALMCVNAVWRGMDTIVTFGTPGAACANAGQTAIDTANNNETLICRANPSGGPARLFRLRDLTTNLVFVTAREVRDGDTVAKPTCQAAAAMTALPLIQMIPKVFNSDDGGFTAYAVDTGAAWITRMQKGDGQPMPGNAVSVAQMFCYFF